MRIIAKVIEVGAMNERSFNTQDGTKTIKFRVKPSLLKPLEGAEAIAP